MTTKASERQKRFRAKQEQMGLVQVRAWVPKALERTYKAIAIAMRTNGRTRPPESITGKQSYELEKLQASMSKTQIPQRVWTCRWQAEVYLTMYGRGTTR